jgi:hypothetical protein
LIIERREVATEWAANLMSGIRYLGDEGSFDDDSMYQLIRRLPGAYVDCIVICIIDESRCISITNNRSNPHQADAGYLELHVADHFHAVRK